MQSKSFVLAMRDHFGQRPGQTLPEFSGELKALSNPERHEFAVMLRGQGVEVKPETIDAPVSKPIDAPIAGA